MTKYIVIDNSANQRSDRWVNLPPADMREEGEGPYDYDNKGEAAIDALLDLGYELEEFDEKDKPADMSWEDYLDDGTGYWHGSQYPSQSP